MAEAAKELYGSIDNLEVYVREDLIRASIHLIISYRQPGLQAEDGADSGYQLGYTMVIHLFVSSTLSTLIQHSV